jgi:hypothetical protein
MKEVDGVTMEDWDKEWGDDKEGWIGVPTKQEAGAGVPAAVTGPVAPAAAMGAPAAVTGATAAVTASVSAVTSAVTRATTEVDGLVDASGLGGGHGGLAVPQLPSKGGHGGYRGPKFTKRPVTPELPGGELTFANLVFEERWGQTSAAHVKERFAYIDNKRVKDLIAGEEAKGGVKFVHKPHSVKSEAARLGRGYIKRGTFRCHHGPNDDTKSPEEFYAATVATQAAAAASGKQPRVGTKTKDGRGLQIGCKCSFGINVLAAHPDVAEVVAPRSKHTPEWWSSPRTSPTATTSCTAWWETQRV